MLFVVLLIISTILITGFAAWGWKEFVKEEGFRFDTLLLMAALTFIGSPSVGLLVACCIYIPICLLGFWLMPIILILSFILGFVYWDYIKEWYQSKEGDKQCG